MLNFFNKGIQFKDLPKWCMDLSKDPRFSELGFTMYSEDDFKKDNKKAKTLFRFGTSRMFSNYNMLSLAVDTEKPDLLRISFNETESEIFFYTEPTMDELEKIYNMYVKEALLIPETGSVTEHLARVLKSEIVMFSNPLKKEIIFCVGHGDWDDDMVVLENSMPMNRYMSLYTIYQATAYTHTDDPAVSQYYTAFSASLCSLIRYEAFSTTFFYLSFEYIPVDTKYNIQFKKLFPDNNFIQQFPDDAPLDILGMFMYAQYGTLLTHDDLFENTKNGGFNDLLYLVAMTDLTSKFDHYFIPLASHANEQIRDFIATEAHTKKNRIVLDEVLKYGVSEAVLIQVSQSWE